MPNEKLGTLDIDIAIDFKKVKKALDKISSSVKRVSIQMAKSIGRAMRGIARASLAVTKKVVGIFSNAFRRIARIVRNAMIVSAVAITALLGISIKAATKQEDALFALQTALKLTGDDTVEAMKDYQNFASALQKTTVIGDEQTLMLLAQHKQLGVNTKDLKKAAEMTIGLSAATGRSQDTITRYVAEALQGEFNSLKRIIPELKGMTNETKMMAVVTKFAANGMKVAEGRILTTSGALQQMKNAVGDVTEVIGQPFLKSIVKSSKVIQKFAEDNQKLIGDFAQKVSDSLDRVKAKIVAFFSDKGNQDNLKEAFKNIVLVLKQIKDWFIKITKEAIAFLKTKEAADIMSKRLEDIKNLAVLIWENLKKAAKWLKDFLTNEKRVKAVVDGFKGIVATVIALGQVLGRATEQISKLSNLFLTLLGVTDENKRAIGKTILNVIGLAAGFGLLRKMGGLLVNNLIGLAKKVFSLQTAMLLLKGTMIAVKIAAGFLITAFKNVAIGMFSLVTKAIPALIANFGILVAAIPGWVAGLTVLKVAIIALKAALVLGGIALAALIGFKIGKWAVENFAWVDSISTGLAKLVIQLTKVINLIPGVNIGGIGSFKKSDDPNFGRSENIGSIMDRKKARASSSALLPADTTLPPNVATPKVATPTLKSSGSVFEDISFSNLKNPLKFIPPEKMEGTMGMLKKAPMLKHRLSGVDQKTSLDAYFNANPIPSGSLRLPGAPQSNRGAPQSNRGITDGEIKLLEQLKIMTAAIEAQPQIQNQLQDVY